MRRVTEQSLSEQMSVGPREIARRLHVFNFVDEDRERLMRAAPFVEARISEIIERFYALQLQDSDIAVVIGDADSLERVKLSTRGYVLTLFSGRFDSDYASGRLRVGKVHRRLGVTPRLYMAGLRNLQAVLDDVVDSVCRAEASVGDADQLKSSLHKILFFDAQLIFEAYIATHLLEMEAATGEVETYAAQLDIRLDMVSPRLQEISTKDALTGLFNRRIMLDRLAHELAVASRHRLPVCVAYVDLNRFKQVNDLEGHAAGDSVLIAMADALRSVTRAVDTPARIGGDEFCLILPRTTQAEARIPLHRIAQAFDARSDRDVTLSIGVAQVGPDRFADADGVLERADQVMYRAKAAAHAIPGHHACFEDGESLRWDRAKA